MDLSIAALHFLWTLSSETELSVSVKILPIITAVTGCFLLNPVFELTKLYTSVIITINSQKESV